MSEFDVIRLLIAIGVLLLMAASAGFALLWQRQQQLSLALQAAQGAQPTPDLLNKSVRQPEAAQFDQPALASPMASISFGSTLAQTSAERGITTVAAPLGAGPGISKGGNSSGQPKVREEDRLRAMLAGRTAIRSNAASPQSRPGSP
jgi:hypothetical protein